MTEKGEIRVTLSESSLFAGIPSDALDEITSVAEKKIVRAGTTIRRRGEPADSCNIILSGAVNVFTKGEGGTKYELVQLGPGDSFGELALLTQVLTAGAMQAVEDTILIEIPRDRFEPILMKYPEVIHAVGKGISRWVHRAGSALEKEVDRGLQAQHISLMDFIIIVGLSVLFAFGFNKANSKGIPLFQNTTLDEAVSFVSPLKACEKLEKGQSLFVDAMPSNFYTQEHIPGSENLPLALFDFIYDLSLADEDKEREIIVYGRSISRRYDEEVANKLSIRSHKNVLILRGGLSAWKKAGCPVEP